MCTPEHESAPCDRTDGTCYCEPGYTGNTCDEGKTTFLLSSSTCYIFIMHQNVHNIIMAGTVEKSVSAKMEHHVIPSLENVHVLLDGWEKDVTEVSVHAMAISSWKFKSRYIVRSRLLRV